MTTLAEECVAQALRTLDIHRMIAPGEKVLVAVSGGPDSMCLLHVLREAGCHIETAYFDHETRDGESTADGEFVREHVGSLGIPFYTESRPVEAEAHAAGLGFEEYARQVRYAFLKRAARDAGCVVLATGHNADDQAETVLMRLLRGTTPHGLAGIPTVRDDEGVRIVRPLIACTRAQVLAYLDAHGIPYRTDRTNADTRYLRNKVRHELLPLLRDRFNPHIDEALVRLAEVQRDEDGLLSRAAQEAYARCVAEDGAVQRRVFADLHPALQRRVVLILAWRHGVDCPFDQVEGAVRFICGGGTGRAFDLGGGVSLRNARDATGVVTQPGTVDPREIALAVPGETTAFGKQFQVLCHDAVPTKDLKAYCLPTRQVFDADAMGTTLSVRHRRPGDRFSPLGMTGSKKLKDYFIDLGIPVTQRDREVLLIANGTIAWVVGHAIAAPVAVTPQTQRTVEVRVTDAVE